MLGADGQSGLRAAERLAADILGEKARAPFRQAVLMEAEAPEAGTGLEQPVAEGLGDAHPNAAATGPAVRLAVGGGAEGRADSGSHSHADT